MSTETNQDVISKSYENSSKILIPVSNNNKLHAIFWRHTNSSKTEKENYLCIFCHGFTGDKTEWGRFPIATRKFFENGFDSLIFDFSGSGENPRVPITLSQQVKDLEDVANWALSNGYNKIITIGLSFGGITSLFAKIKKRSVAIFWAPAFYMNRIVGGFKGVLASIKFAFSSKPLKLKSSGAGPSILINKHFFKELSSLKVEHVLQSFKTPSLIVQGLKDNVVKPEMTREAFNFMPKDEHHKLVEVEGTGHDFSGIYLERFIDESLAFLNSELK